MRAHDEMMQFLTSGPTVTQIVNYTPSKQAQKRVQELERHKEVGQLTPDEHAELRAYGRTVAFLQQIKERALRRIARA